jgi:hypothetical protein
MYFLLFLLLALLTAGVIALLHRYQLQTRKDIVDRTAPLAALDLSYVDQLAPGASSNTPMPDVPVFGASAPAVMGADNWQEQIKQLRDQGREDAALALCRQHFPRIQAFQQAAIILRHRVRSLLEANRSVTGDVTELYRIAVMADLYRNSNPVKPRNAQASLQQLQQRQFDYNAIGTRQLRLLTKSDVRHLEQLWGRPARHQHAEDCPGVDWKVLCQ